MDEEQKDSDKLTTRAKVTLGIIIITNVFANSCAALQSPFYPKEASSRGVTPTEYGFVFGIYHLSNFVCTIVYGKLTENISCKLMMNIGCFTLGVSTILFGIIEYFQDKTLFLCLSFLLRVLEGIGFAALRVSFHTTVGTHYKCILATASGLIFSAGSVGYIVGPTMGGILFDLSGFSLPFYTCGSVVLILGIIIHFILPQATDVQKNETDEKLWKLWISPDLIAILMLAISSRYIVGFVYVGIEFHIREYNLTALQTGLIFATLAAMVAIFSPFCGQLCDHGCEEKMIGLFGYLLSLISILLLGPVPFLGLKKYLSTIIVGLSLMGIAFAFKTIPVFGACYKVTLSKGYSSSAATFGRISSIMLTYYTIGAFLGPSVGGYLLDNMGFLNSLYVQFGVEAFMAFLLLVYICVDRFKTKNNETTCSERATAKRNGQTDLEKNGQKVIQSNNRIGAPNDGQTATQCDGQTATQCEGQTETKNNARIATLNGEKTVTQNDVQTTTQMNGQTATQINGKRQRKLMGKQKHKTIDKKYNKTMDKQQRKTMHEQQRKSMDK